MATSMFVKFCPKSGIIEGECEEIGHDKWCEITSLKQKFSIEDKDEETTDPQRAKHEPIAISKIIDKASIELLKHCRDGRPLKEVIIECVRAHVAAEGKAPIHYFQIVLENVIIRQFQYRVDEGNLVSEELELVARKATYNYRELNKFSGSMVTPVLANAKEYELRDDDFDDAPDRSDYPYRKMSPQEQDAYDNLSEKQKEDYKDLFSRRDKKKFLADIIKEGQR